LWSQMASSILLWLLMNNMMMNNRGATGSMQVVPPALPETRHACIELYAVSYFWRLKLEHELICVVVLNQSRP
jgi:hypothetical protein